MIRFFAGHPTAANLLMVALLLLGLTTLPQIKRETFPEIKSYSVEISVPYPGATPSDVEQGICLPLEDALDGISFIEEKDCDARQNLGKMTVKMLERGNFDEFIDDVQNAVDEIDDFPEQAEIATVSEKGRTQDVVSVALTAAMPRAELKTLAEQVKQRMLQHPQIPQVEVSGFSERQLLVEVPSYNLRQYGLSLQDLALLIDSQNVDMPLGTFVSDDQEVQLRLNDERRSPVALAELQILTGELGNEVRLGDIATIVDTFELAEDKVEFNGQQTAILKVVKNTIDDSLRVLDAVKDVIAQESQLLPPEVKLSLTQDSTSIVQDRIRMLASNAWQGLLLVFAVMWLFFSPRYAFWVVMGLPVSFLAAFFVLDFMGVTINMISMVALLLALGILMDDAIVISESIGSHLKKGLKPLEAAVKGTSVVARGVLSSFATTICIFFGLAFIEGDLGQVLRVIPIVLITVITISLIEAFLILPSHLYHSMAHAAKRPMSDFRKRFEQHFERFRQFAFGKIEVLIQYRYAFIGSVIALFLLSFSMLASGILKFSAFPNVEGDLLQARILMPAGTPLKRTEQVVDKILAALEKTNSTLSVNEKSSLVKSVTVSYSQNADAFESGPHLATITADLLTSERRNSNLQSIKNLWRENTGVIPQAFVIAFKEPALGPSGRAIHVRLSGNDLAQLSEASLQLQSWLDGYPGVYNLMSDLRPGKPEFTMTLKEGAMNLGIDAHTLANQVRAAFQGTKVQETNVDLETFEITVKLAEQSRDEFVDFDTFPIIHPQTKVQIPLSAVADIEATRGYSRINRINNMRTVSVYGDIDADVNNTASVVGDLKTRYLQQLEAAYPGINVAFEGEVKNSGTTNNSIMNKFMLGIFGVFALLSFQFRNYSEPLVVMVTIPLALIGVIWGHLIMGLDFTMPSTIGFTSLAGIVVNDSILLVERVKARVAEGMNVHDAAAHASYDRFRAVFLTSITTVAGITPLLFETSLQAQVLVPLATSIVFGIVSSTLLVLFVIPCLYTILEDFGLAKAERPAAQSRSAQDTLVPSQ